ncbi:abortive infection family protein [Crateriforma spongiae]|uniref:abortive infection family protein n=1 Tax=Crateriforma spongiae TaxID=2724528 RepID=UPI0014452365|nr:abortive infection family protein [Crateriforma spongiae]
MQILHELQTEYERADALVHLLIDHATGGHAQESDFVALRQHFLDSPHDKLLPAWFRSKRSLNQFWQFIKNKYPTYAERRTYLWDEFDPLLRALETGGINPSHDDMELTLDAFDAEGVRRSWRRVTRRIHDDPEGAITAARELVETVLKHILDDNHVSYDGDRIELPQLYKLVQKELNLAPEDHQEQIFKQILTGCSGVVNGLGAVRNRLGDAHGKGVANVRPHARHARLATNLAGTMALFLMETHLSKKG